MKQSIYITGDSPALLHAGSVLREAGIRVESAPEDAGVLLYNIPTAAFDRDDIPKGRYIIGGNLDFLDGSFRKLDLLRDPEYVAANAALTAEAALGILLPKFEREFSDIPTLVIGWGRIGKCMSKLLQSIGIPVTVCARKAADRAILAALGYTAAAPEELVDNYRCIINTAPAPVLNFTPAEAIQIDLASSLSLPGTNVIHARGLPGKYKAEASGKLIAQTILRHRKEVFAS